MEIVDDRAWVEIATWTSPTPNGRFCSLSFTRNQFGSEGDHGKMPAPCLLRRAARQTSHGGGFAFSFPLGILGEKSISRARELFELGVVAHVDFAQADGDQHSRGVRRNPENNPDRKSTHLNSSHVAISYAVFCLKKKKTKKHTNTK